MQYLGRMQAPGLGAALVGLRFRLALVGGESRPELPEEDEELVSGKAAWPKSKPSGTVTCSMGEAMAAATV